MHMVGCASCLAPREDDAHSWNEELLSLFPNPPTQPTASRGMFWIVDLRGVVSSCVSFERTVVVSNLCPQKLSLGLVTRRYVSDNERITPLGGGTASVKPLRHAYGTRDDATYPVDRLSASVSLPTSE